MSLFESKKVPAKVLFLSCLGRVESPSQARVVGADLGSLEFVNCNHRGRIKAEKH